jgi:hypothetical protein
MAHIFFRQIRLDYSLFYLMVVIIIRNRLSYEQFGAFLANVKELNSHKQTREVIHPVSALFLLIFSHQTMSSSVNRHSVCTKLQVTLQKADEIFGPENKDLYTVFEGLITRNVH